MSTLDPIELQVLSGGPVELELGAAAEKWARKILNPPSLMDKLGVPQDSLGDSTARLEI